MIGMRKALLCLILGLVSIPVGAQEPVAVCAARNLDPATALWVERMTERLAPEALDVKPVRIPIAFHIITSGKEGRVKTRHINTLISRLNWGFRDTPFSFYLARVDRMNKPSWYKDCGPGTANEAAMKKRLAVDPKTTLNLYSCKPYIPEINAYVLGYSSFPFENTEGSYMHGIMLHPAGLPGGTDPRYNRYGLAAHEVGHYLGLFHTFQNGCQGNGDSVADTGAQAQPHNGCPVGADTCPDAAADDVHNFMNYSDDLCSEHFTPGQIERAILITGSFRPSLVNW